MPARFSLRRRPSTPQVAEPDQADTAQLPAAGPGAASAWQRPPAHGEGAGPESPDAYPDPVYEEGSYEEGAYEDPEGAYEEGPGYYPAVYGAGVPGGLEDGALDEDDESWLAPDTRRRVKVAIPTFLLGALVVVAGAFWGGAEIDKHFGEHNNTTSAGSLASALRSSGLGSFRGAGGEGFRASGAGGFGGSNALTPAAQGTLSAVSGDDLTVTPTAGGAKVRVVMNASTVVTRSGKGAAGALSVGDTVTVLGTKSAQGTVTATSVTASAPGVSAGGGLGGGSGFVPNGGFSGNGGAATGGSGPGGSGLVKNGGFSGDGSGASGG